LDSPAARAKLKPSGKPYWRAIDGVGILDFFQAQRKAREVASKSKEPARGPFTVSVAMAAYFARRENEGGAKSLAGDRGRASRHILTALGDVPVADLTRDMLSKWLAGLAAKAQDGQDAEAVRQHRASANRVLTILRAALNQAFRDGKIGTDVAWRTVKPFRGVDAPRLRYFTQDEVRRLINAAQGSFRNLVKAALFTGCRYGELIRLRAGDLNTDSGTIFVAESKSGKSRHVVLTDEGGMAWAPSHQIRLMAEACSAARITDGSFHILRHTAASHLVMAGVPLNVVAHNLGHSSTLMTEKHYAHLAPSYVAETIRKFAPDFGTLDDTMFRSGRNKDNAN
jgi:integrase